MSFYKTIKKEDCSKFAPKSIFLKTVKEFMSVAKMDANTNLKPVTYHNKEDLFNQIADSNIKIRLLYLNALRDLNNPYATDRIIASLGVAGADITFSGVNSNQVKYVEIKCIENLDPIKYSRKGYMDSLAQINRSRNLSPEQLSLSFVQIVNAPVDGMSVLNKFSYDLRTSIPDIRDLTKNVYFSLVSKNGTLSVDSEEVKIPPKK